MPNLLITKRSFTLNIPYKMDSPARYLRGEREDIEIEMRKATPRKKIKIV